MIKKVGSSWVLYTSDGSRILGRHKDRADAVAQELAIKIESRRRLKEPRGGWN